MRSRPPRRPVAFVVGVRPSHGIDGAAPMSGPPVDVLEHERGFTIVVEVPGADPSRLDVAVQGRFVTVRGDRAATSESGRYLCMERAVGPFERTVELPDEPDAEHADASYGDGLLRIELARRSSSSRTIRIGRGGDA